MNNHKFELGMIVKVDGELGLVVGYNYSHSKAKVEWFNAYADLPEQLWDTADGLEIVADPAQEYRILATHNNIYKINFPDGTTDCCPSRERSLLDRIYHWAIRAGLGYMDDFSIDSYEFLEDLEADGKAVVKIRTHFHGDYKVYVHYADG